MNDVIIFKNFTMCPSFNPQKTPWEEDLPCSFHRWFKSSNQGYARRNCGMRIQKPKESRCSVRCFTCLIPSIHCLVRSLKGERDRLSGICSFLSYLFPIFPFSLLSLETLSTLLSTPTLPWPKIPFIEEMCWVGQKVHLDFSIKYYRKTRTNFWSSSTFCFYED